jgi:hypothetical protein
MGKILIYGRSVGGKTSVDRCGSRYYTYRNISRSLGKLGSKGKVIHIYEKNEMKT